MVYYYLWRFCIFVIALFSGFLQFQGNFVNGQNNSKSCDVAPLSSKEKATVILQDYWERMHNWTERCFVLPFDETDDQYLAYRQTTMLIYNAKQVYKKEMTNSFSQILL